MKWEKWFWVGIAKNEMLGKIIIQMHLNKKSLIQTNQASLINPEKVTNHNRTIYVSILSTILKGVKH